MTDSWLPAEHGADNQNLQRRVARGATWTIIDNWGKQLLLLVSFVILARLLEPEDFGLVALAMVFVVFAQLFVDQGLGDALVQRKVLTREHIDTAFWAALALGSALTVAGIVLAIPIAALLNQPRLEPLLQVLSLAFALTALSAIQLAILQRELRFRSLAIRTLFSIAGGGALGIALAVMGYGAWALVAQQLATAGLSVAALWAASPWRPRLRFSGAHFRELFGFGANIVGSDLLNYLTRYSDNLLIGVVLGAERLGIYAVGYRILDSTNSLLTNVTRKVSFPVLSRLQHDEERRARAYVRLTRVSAALIVPGYIGLALVGPELISAIFGARWLESGHVAAVLFLVGPVFAVQAFGGALLNSAGRPDIVLRYRLANMITTVIGFAVAVPFGILAVAAAFVIRGYLMLPLQLYLQRRYAAVPTRGYLIGLRGPIVATAVMAGALLGVRVALGPDAGHLLLLLASLPVGVLSYLGAVGLLERGLLGEVLDVAGQALPGAERARRRLGRGRRPDEQIAQPEVTAETTAARDPLTDL